MKTRHLSLPWSLTLAMILCFQTVLEATTVLPPTFDELVKEAEVIFEGRVTKKVSNWVGEGGNRTIQTGYTFQVAETLKGSVPATYVLKVMGGTVGEVSLKVDGAPNFQLGDRALLFVTHNGTQFVPLVGIMHGHFRIETDAKSQQEVLIKHDGVPLRDSADVGKGQAEPGGRLKKLSDESRGLQPITPRNFKDQVRAKLQEQAR